MKDNIVTDLNKSYGISINQITPVTGGLMNLKWKISTNKGEFLVKQYSMERFSKEKIEIIEQRLQRQVHLEKNNVPCPFLLQCEGRRVRNLDDETFYMVMEFCNGATENADTISIKQMHSLGTACAIMHKEFSKLTEVEEKKLPVADGYTIKSLWENFDASMAKYTSNIHNEYREVLYTQESILKQLNDDFFHKLPKGFAHEDFHNGNILFAEDGVSAIVDFDRNCYSYIWHDIGRAILSFALEGD